MNAPGPLPRRAPRPSAGQAGFTLAEMLVAVTLSTLLILGVLALFDANTRIARVQTDVAEMQQAQRVVQTELVRWSRMVGRGGLPVNRPPAFELPAGLALSVRNNVPADTHISPTDVDTPLVRQETDVLLIRGVLRTPLFQVQAGQYGNALNDFTVDPGLTAGSVIVRNPTREGIPQDLAPLREVIDGDRPEAIFLVSVLEDTTYAVVELDPDASSVANDGSTATLGFLIQGGTHTNEYIALSAGGTYPPALNAVIYLGILEEYQYYVRELQFGSETVSMLTMARTYPGTQVPHADSAANWEIEIADNVLDLQAAVGVDLNANGAVEDGNVLGTATDTDEWLFNDPDDVVGTPSAWAAGVASYLRLTTLVVGDRPDLRYEAPLLLFIEDHSYGSSPLNSPENRRFRRRAVQTVVDLRNLG
jgi:type II secretory pathway pseudopilin PulG